MQERGSSFMLKSLVGIFLALCIGVGCRFFGIPLPGPPAILGAILAVAMATGYTLTDKFLSARDEGRTKSSVVASEASEPLSR
jgi:XapX domain-containing protein